jgi:hypothetical protein
LSRKAGRPMENNKPVRINETGEVYPNYVEAAKAIDGNRSCVYLCLHGYRSKHKGYTFSYEEDEV